MANIKGLSPAGTSEDTCRKQGNRNPEWRGRKTGSRPPQQRKRNEHTGRAGPSPENGQNLWAGRFFSEEAHREVRASGAHSGRAVQGPVRRDAVFSECSGKPLEGFR